MRSDVVLKQNGFKGCLGRDCYPKFDFSPISALCPSLFANSIPKSLTQSSS
ncbi:hypothetical protein RchiOBHm_Chr3g0492901 [Rosa chinensis]|uniref:Uncharacterized protein n=1 Tax=Rosa chinensis TaxID=74649 RepID=A0A2P6RGM7_ROSCH|nr:hypothetical protein RchiOBHm_Chr3g0492901 [Rosa chinensis]